MKEMPYLKCLVPYNQSNQGFEDIIDKNKKKKMGP
jgi:hypothetical protein